MKNSNVVKKGSYKHPFNVPNCLNVNERNMFIAFAKSVRKGLFAL